MNSRTRVKICGVTRPGDARLACALGADAIGTVFVARSKRSVSVGQAGEIRAAVDGFAALVALFADPSPQGVEEVVDNVRPDLLQFHGSESPEFCARFGVPYIKALPVALAARQAAQFRSARALIVDSHQPGQLGGTGNAFDWSRFPRDIAGSVILAGGLTPDNVGEAVAGARPYGVDVSSGVESAPGIKDSQLLERFFEEIRRVDSGQAKQRD